MQLLEEANQKQAQELQAIRARLQELIKERDSCFTGKNRYEA